MRFLGLFTLVFGALFSSASASDDSVAAKIASAMSAGPPEIARAARIIEMNAQGTPVVLRDGANGFTCMPGDPGAIGQPPMCMDAPSMQWAADFRAHKPKPTNTVPGITYILAGATERDDSDPYNQTGPPVTLGPHWMILWPFDAKSTGLPSSRQSTGSYIVWAGTPYAHMRIMGRP